MKALMIILVISSAASKAEGPQEVSGYVCASELSTGYALAASGKWAPTQFNVVGEKFFLKREKDGWYWGSAGQEDTISQKRCDKFDKYGFTRCDRYGTDIRFNRNSLRFQAINPDGYVVSDDKMDGKINPYYTIGTCTKL